MVSAQAFFIHSKLTGLRKQSMNQLAEKLGSELHIEHEVIDEHDTDMLDLEQIKKYVDLSKSNKSEFFDAAIKNLHIRSVSNALKHYTALRKASRDADYIFVFEDDVLFGDNMIEKIKEILNNTEHTWDICFLGLPSLHPIQDENKIQYEEVPKSFKVVPSCDAYVIRKSAIDKICSNFSPIRFNTNLQYSYLFETAGVNACYTVPNLFVDGSKMGIYLSSIESNNRLYMNPEYNQLSQLVRRDTYTDEDKAAIEKIMDTIKFKNHPDIQLLFGIYYEKISQIEKAKQTLEDAYNVLQQNGCIVNNESELLYRFINIHKHFQQ